MILSPLPSSLASWSDIDSDGNNDTWIDPNTSQATTLADLNTQNYDADNDGATNDEEAVEGSDPFSFDSDYDGISDGDELHIVKPILGTSLTDWDSNDDLVSDYDAWHSFSGVIYSGGELPSHPGASYSDYDGDSFKNPVDPFPTDPANFASVNNVAWYGDVFGDADSDSISNWQDGEPYGPPNNDADGDNIPDSLDPFSYDSTNYSTTNAIYWYGDVFGDADSDGMQNWQDGEPYGPPIIDSDDDGIQNTEDPFPTDSYNYSSLNNTSWHGDVFGDSDSDTILNYNDPFPSDGANYSSTNSIQWYADVWGDADNDSTPNWQDSEPYGSQAPDTDADGIVDATDPFPNDANNYAPINGIAWYTDVFGDADGDSLLNWEDPTPSPPPPPDDDGDGILNDYDPYPTDNTNFSNINNTSWYADVSGDNDNDGILNWTDPYPSDATNFCTLNNTAWYGTVLNDDDTDGYPNWQDHNPSPYIDQDGDGIPNGQDPYYLDNTNFSSTNGVMWYQDVLGDADSDGRLNYEDMWPNDPLNDPDRDGDGLRTSQETSHGTSDFDVDCDDDGLTDYEELIVYFTNPLNAHDLSQDRGWGNLYTDYQLVDTTDTDSDGIPNRIEIFYGMLPNNTEDGFGDLDGNGMNNTTQYSAGLALDVDLTLYDQDGDGLTDIFEDYYELNKTNPADAMEDADDDGVLNFEEAKLLLSPLHTNSRDIEGLTDLYFLVVAMVYPETTPEWEDENNNNLPDWYDDALAGTSPVFTRIAPNDLDGDGMPDTWEHKYGHWKFPASGLYVRHDDADGDPDSDSLTNLQEYQLNTNPLIADSNGDGVDDADEDSDNDGISNRDEIQDGTNALDADSDNDGFSDFQELQGNSNALDGESTPPDPQSPPPPQVPEVTVQTRYRSLFWSFWEGHQDSNTEDEYDDSTIGGGHYAIGNARGVTKYLAAWSDNWSGLAAPAGQEAADLVATASQYGSMIWDDEPTFPPFVPLNEWDNGGFTYDSAPYWWPLDYAPPDGWVSASYVSVNASRDETVQGVYYNSNGDPVDVSIPQIFYNQVRLKVNGIHPYGDTRRFLVVKENKGRDESSPEFTTENKVIGVATLSIPAGTNLCNATFTPAGSEGTPDVQVSTFGDGSKGLTVEPLIAADYTSYDYKSAAVTFKPIEININDTSDTKDDVVRRRPKGRRQKASPMGSLHRARTR